MGKAQDGRNAENTILDKTKAFLRPTESPLQSELYPQANRLSIFLNEDPREGESLRDFLVRHTGHYDEKSVNEFIENARKERLAKWNERELAIRNEKKRIREAIRDGVEFEIDPSVLDSEEAERYQQSLHEIQVRKELERIKGLMLEGKSPNVNRDLVNTRMMAQLKLEVFEILREKELGRIRCLLENGEDPGQIADFIRPDEIEEIRNEIEGVRHQWLRNRTRPASQIYGVSNYGAESLVADWLRYLGFSQVAITQASGDGGVDVVTETHLCQVKNYSAQPVSVQEVREIFGVAVSEGKQPIIFTSASLSSSAFEFAEKNNIPAIRYDAGAATLAALNVAGEQILAQGEYSL